MKIEDWKKYQEDFLYNFLKGTPFKGDTPLEKANLLDKVSKRLREME